MLKSVSSSKTLTSQQVTALTTFDAHIEINPYGALSVVMKCYGIYMLYVVRTGSFPSMYEEPVSIRQHMCTFRRSPGKVVGLMKLPLTSFSTPIQQKTGRSPTNMNRWEVPEVHPQLRALWVWNQLPTGARTVSHLMTDFICL